MTSHDTLPALLAGLTDQELAQSAAAFGRRADRLAASRSPEDRAWASIFGYLAAASDVALLSRQTGIAF
jgi:hypothetical protein